MEAESSQRHTWVRIGATYGAVVAERIVALVYHGGALHGETQGNGGGGSDVTPGWFLVWSDQPHQHFQLSSPPLTAEMSSGQRDEAAYVALAEAGKAIEDKLGDSTAA